MRPKLGHVAAAAAITGFLGFGGISLAYAQDSGTESPTTTPEDDSSTTTPQDDSTTTPERGDRENCPDKANGDQDGSERSSSSDTS